MNFLKINFKTLKCINPSKSFFMRDDNPLPQGEGVSFNLILI